MLAFLEFCLAGALITFAGAKLALYGDVIGTRTGLGGTWVGLVLLAVVTSLPELITGVSAVVLADAPNIAVGAILGSCVFNLTILVIIDTLAPAGGLRGRLGRQHILSAAYGIISIGVVGFSLLLEQAGRGVAIGRVGVYTPIVAVIYVIAVRAAFRHEPGHDHLPIEEARGEPAPISLRSAALRYALAASVVVATGVWLPFLGQRLALALQVNETFIGSLLIALATSLPEVVVTVAAVRIAAFDMAVSNLFGSNLFNVLILGIEDLCFARGPILGAVSELHVVSAFSAIVMTGIAVVGLMYGAPRGAIQRIRWASLLLIAIYLANFYILYLFGQ